MEASVKAQADEIRRLQHEKTEAKEEARPAKKQCRDKHIQGCLGFKGL